MGAIWAGVRALLRALWRATRQLFHEITGSLFVLLTLIGAFGTWREWKQGTAGWMMAIPVAFTLMMGFFAVSAFVSARRVR